jgi:5'-3' exonuclease
MFKGTEADDVIAYICRHKLFADCEKIILSSDKDFFQLLDKNTVLYRPIQKQIINQKSLIEQFNVHPTNFAMARAFAGDKSDNIEGLGGIGLKTAAKRFPFLREERSVTFDKILNYCRKMTDETNVKIYDTVMEKRDLLKRNYHMMQLYAPILDIDEKKIINETLQSPDISFNKTELIKMMMIDGFGEINFIELFQHFRKMSLDNI